MNQNNVWQEYLKAVPELQAPFEAQCRENWVDGTDGPYVIWGMGLMPCILERLAVRADRRGEGLGAAALQYAADAAEAEGARYLRLLVVDFNRPAAALYRKCGFRRVDGVYHNVVDGDRTLLEYGFEKRL